MLMMRRVAAVLCTLLAAVVLAAQGVPTGKPESAGMSSERLARIRPVMQRAVDGKEVAAVETLVMRKGVIVHHERIGIDPDAIFRLASMTKPVTSVAAMMLVEEGRLLLSDPVSRYIPAFKDSRVVAPAGTNGGGDGGTVAARRALTVEDLITHRAGLIYSGMDRTPLKDEYDKAGIYPGIGPDAPASLASNIDRLGGMPLKFQPGSAWQYGLSTDVLGRVVEVASEMSLEEFFRKRIFEPLGMRDTHFNLPAAKASRLVPMFALDKGILSRSADQGNSVGLTYFSGGAGLVGTTADYLRFARMLLNRGELDGVRILGRKTVELMTANHTSDLGPSAVRPGYGFGYGFDVRESVGGSHRAASEGTFGWSGAYGTWFWVDPSEQMVSLLMHQLMPRNTRLSEAFQALTYGAIVN